MALQEQTTLPLYPLLEQINAAAKNGLHLIAIGMASALPTICASLAAENGRAGGKEYKNWCTENLSGAGFDFVTAEDLYSIRCGVLHQGRFGDLQHSVARVIFAPPGGASFTNCQFGDAYVYGVVEFCENLCKAAFKWYEANKTNPIVEANSKRMMQYYLDGLPPYIVGMPVIA
ncbi:hypothetical protein [Magnetospirillum molischianum]|uniref:Uncharacterized protein n=1 Tax=Magnetospirillum molischianum DSM 120 TaxID=1150626 RepID=H8FQL9_MAGML|nr:hypothetical protein [Magnetospirillum molischianum]CCG40657.1 conserved hypothetical protein [Magnetospirillum molischianum DSM 120]